MNPRRERTNLRAWLAAIIFILALVVLLLATLPETRIQQVLPFPSNLLPSPTPVSMLCPWGGA